MTPFVEEYSWGERIIAGIGASILLAIISGLLYVGIPFVIDNLQAFGRAVLVLGSVFLLVVTCGELFLRYVDPDDEL